MASILPQLSVVTGTTSTDCSTFLSNWDHSDRAIHERSKAFTWRNSFRKFENVGSLIVKVYRAKGLYAADLGGYSDPFCVLELDNTRVQTHTEYKTLDPVWQKVCHNIMHNSIKIKVFLIWTISMLLWSPQLI